MTPIIPLTKIGFFNPGRLTDEEIEQSFIARVSFFQFIFNKIISEKPNSIPQHHLIIGQRGMGKTSLLMRIAAELRKPPFKETFIALTFPEEQYNVDRLSKFWLNCLDALADALDKEHKTVELNALDAEISRLSKEKALDANNIYETFKKWLANIKRRPVLLVDNLNLIFSKISKEEQHQLRAILISEDAPILIGASATAIEETLNYQAPFYDAFQINYLKKLTFHESIDVLVNLARITGNSNFENTIYLKKGRIEALYDLTGGTPRTLAILFPLIQNGFSEDIHTDLDALLDLVTPLYKARFEELAPQLQVVLDAVALHWDPTTLEQLRDITFLENQQISPQLKRLMDVGWLQKLDAYKAKGGAYELSERFFNIWYLMRRSSRRQKRELYCLTKFLESFYGNELHEIAKARLSGKRENANQIAIDLALADGVKDKELAQQLRERRYEDLIELSFKSENILKNFTVPQDVVEKKLRALVDKTNIEIQNKNYKEAEILLRKISKVDKDNKFIWFTLGNIYNHFLFQYQDAEYAYTKAFNIDENDTALLNELGNLYESQLSNYKKAVEVYKKIIGIDVHDAKAWHRLGFIYSNYLGEYLEAEAAYKKAVHLTNDSNTWSNLGNLYGEHLNRLEESEKAYKKAIDLKRENPAPWHGLGALYANHLHRFEEAEVSFLKSIELGGKNAAPWQGLGNLYTRYIGRFLEAENAYRKAIELDPQSKGSWNNLGNLYAEHLGRYEDAEEAFKKAIELDKKNSGSWNNLGNLYLSHFRKYQEAEKAYKAAIEIDEKFAQPWIGLGNLYMDLLGKYLEAEHAFKKAIDINETLPMAWFGLANLNMRHLSRYNEAEINFKKALQFNDRDANIWNNLGNLNLDYLHNYIEAEKVFLRTIEIDPDNDYPKYNLLFLWRDKMNKPKEAKELFNTLVKSDELKDTYLLNKSLFAYYDKNIGIAEAYLKEALISTGDLLPLNTIDDWYRSAAVLIKLDYIDSLLNTLIETGYDIKLKPFYVAIEAITKKEDDLFLNSIAAEVREPAKKIMALIKNHLE